MGRHHQNWLFVFRDRLSTSVKKLNFLLCLLKLSKWRLASTCGAAGFSHRSRSWSFNDRLGLENCIADDQESDESNSVRTLQRTKSCVNSGSDDDDINRRADIFIANFRRRLLYEKQVSLELSYRRGN
ncbi:DUF761 domain-containing protein [Melia azedarach]|uniref:DUF761 domain-containing protein n=2 Tax=Melia azedarach TaxID=155640 RepID=A0ACC1XEI2_MELAZ|nr:DUF761 domain-containing protein [Melia azedarach]KAJ4709705.1 DUF761 domain-containing protein [Melia azedarach]